MYFSSNSRYVLHRTQWIAPSTYILKGAERFLGVKAPNDDPSKPPLRVNIPQEGSGLDNHTKLLHNTGIKGRNFEPRSKSLASRPTPPFINPGYADSILTKSESEIRLPQIETEDDLIEGGFNRDSGEGSPQALMAKDETFSKENNVFSEKGEEYQEGLSTPLHDPATEEALANNYMNNPTMDTLRLASGESRETALVPSVESSERMLYIILDQEEAKFPSVAEQEKIQLATEDLTGKIPTQKTRASKTENSSNKKSKSITKLPVPNRELVKKFEVQEIEDGATYVFHSKHGRDHLSKFGELGCVPEKQLSTRSDSSKNSEALIRAQGGKSFKGIQNEVASVEVLPNFTKVNESKRKLKNRKSDIWGLRGDRIKGMGKTAYYSPSPAKSKSQTVAAPVATSFAVESQQVDHQDIRTEPQLDIAKPLYSSKADDFSPVKAANRPKIAAEVSEVKTEETIEAVSPSETSVTTELLSESRENYPAMEAKPEYNITKVDQTEIKMETPKPKKKETVSRQLHSHLWKDNVNPKKSSSVHVQTSDWVAPRPATPTKSHYRKIIPKKNKKPTNKRGKQAADSESSPKKVDPPTQGKTEKNPETDFQTCGSVVSIGCDKVPTIPVKFSAAFPPLLCEALKLRGRILGFRREFLFADKWTGRLDFAGKHFDTGSKPTQKSQIDLSENAILFPKNSKFDCCSLFAGNNETTAGSPKDEKSPKISDNIANVANENLMESKGEPSVDSLAMMKKVKEMVDLDLENAIKIFKKVDDVEETPSVMILEGEKWKVDTKMLELCMQTRRNESEVIFGGERTEMPMQDIPQELPKYLPPRRNCEIKLSNDTSSVVVFNPDTNEYLVNKEVLESAIQQRAEESFDDVIIQTLEGQLTKGSGNESIVMFDARDGTAYEAKSGDSILVFDEDTQSWKVDFSILEKREQQHRLEEELTKRSELILETFEKLEQNQVSRVPLPLSKDKKTFDYSKEEWKVYPTEKSKEKSSKSKLPFKESNAEEIRRNNSDLYENLFVGNKKETTMNNDNSNNPTTKGSKSCSPNQKKAAASGTGSGKKTTKEPKSKLFSTGPGGRVPCDKEDDNYWGSFLNMNILPRDIREIPKIRPPPPPPPPPPVPPKSQPPDPKKAPKKEDPKPTIPTPKIEDPKPIIPQKRIEEPKKSTYKIHFPFIGDRKVDESRIKPPSKESPKVDEPKKKPSTPPPSAGEAAKQDIKAPAKDAPKVEEPKKKPPAPPPTAGSGPKQEIKTPPAPKEGVKAPSKEKAKVQDSTPKAPPPSATSSPKEEKPTPGKPVPKVEDPKKKPPETPIAGGTKETPKVQNPKSKPSEAPPRASGDAKPDTNKKAPAASIQPKIEDPRANKPPPTIGAPTKPENQNPYMCGKREKSAADHYISENIVEISRNTIKEIPAKVKVNKLETVKLNITADKRMPSRVTEINLNKKCDEKGKDSNPVLNTTDTKKQSEDTTKKNEKCSVENKSFYRNFEKYKSPFSDPEYEEKSMKIKSDIESNPNLKKLDNWNKTLVLHDIGKPPENIENWLKDETDKMATLLLKVLQEAADGKPRKKQLPIKPKDKFGKSSPFDNTPKKYEPATPENFLFRVRTVNLSLDNDKKLKPSEDQKPKLTPVKESMSEKLGKPYNASKLFVPKESPLPTTMKEARSSSCTEVQKSRHMALESMTPTSVSKDFDLLNAVPTDITEEIPGPEFLKKLSNTWKMFPIVGSQMTIFTLLRAFQLVNLGMSIFGSAEKTRANAFSKLFAKYGPIVNVQGPFSGNVILLHRPEHFNCVFEQDSLLTVRSVFDSMEQSRRSAEEKVVTAAISTDWSKPQWNELRISSNDPMIRGSERFFEAAEFAGDSLVGSIRKTRNLQNFVSEDFMEEIKRWSLEGMCSMMFEKSFGFLDRKDSNMSWIMEPDKLYLAFEEATHCLSKCEVGFQTWRLISTPSSLGLGQSYRTLSTLLSKQLYKAEMSLKTKNDFIKEGSSLMMDDLTFLEGMLLNDGMSLEEITCNLIDIILIGTNVMNSALGFLLYHLAQNAKVQNKLLKELQTVLPTKNSRLDYQSLHSLKYLRACLKESLRLHMPIPLFYRMLQNDILLANYVIPKGTYVVMDFKLTCMKDQIFDDPDKFIPERWINDDKWVPEVHPFDTFPLCHGPRADLARRLLDMQLSACVAKVVRNFGIEYHFGEIEGTRGLITLPEKPLKLNFVEREN